MIPKREDIAFYAIVSNLRGITEIYIDAIIAQPVKDVFSTWIITAHGYQIV